MWNVHLLPTFSFLADEINFSSMPLYIAPLMCPLKKHNASFEQKRLTSWWSHLWTSLWVWCSWNHTSNTSFFQTRRAEKILRCTGPILNNKHKNSEYFFSPRCMCWECQFLDEQVFSFKFTTCKVLIYHIHLILIFKASEEKKKKKKSLDPRSPRPVLNSLVNSMLTD